MIDYAAEPTKQHQSDSWLAMHQTPPAKGQAEDLKTAVNLLTRCRDSAGRMDAGLYDDIQVFLHYQPRP